MRVFDHVLKSRVKQENNDIVLNVNESIICKM